MFDTKVRLLPSTVSPHLLRALVAGSNDDAVRIAIPNHDALLRGLYEPIGTTSLLIGLCAVAGGLPIGYRVLRGKQTSPGEFLYLIFGVNQMAFFPLFLGYHRFELAPQASRWENAHVQFILWFFPRLAGCLVGVIAHRWYRANSQWRILFLFNLILWSLAAVDAFFFDLQKPVEESLLTAAPPFVMGLVALAAILITVGCETGPRGWGRHLYHWGGLLVSLLPMVWFLSCMSSGWVYPRLWFDRIID